MNNFGILYLYELRKIFKRKIVWITLAIMLLLNLFMVIGVPLTTVYSNTMGEDTRQMNGFEYIMRNKEYAMMQDGLKIDDSLLLEVKAAYQRVQTVTGEAGGIAEKREQYREIYQYIRSIMGNYEAVYSITADVLYRTRLENIRHDWAEQRLTQGEMEYWAEKESMLETPFVYGYAEGWSKSLEEFLTLNFMLVLIIAVCLSDIFSKEHSRKTDQLILCSRNGKKSLYFSKLAAGMTFGLGAAVFLLVTSILPTLLLYGAEGGGVAVQVYIYPCSRKLTMLQAVLLMSGIFVAAGVFLSIAAMFLSELLENGISVMGIMTGGMFITMMVSIPYRYRVLSQLYELLPTVLLRVWQFCDNRLVSIFGMRLTNFWAAALLWLITGILFIFLGRRSYKNYQVRGR